VKSVRMDLCGGGGLRESVLADFIGENAIRILQFGWAGGENEGCAVGFHRI
jgi:hypothetical protein